MRSVNISHQQHFWNGQRLRTGVGRIGHFFFATWTGRILLAIVILGVIGRLLLPTLLRDYVNRALSQLKGHQGQIADIDVALIRGAYVIKGIAIQKIDGSASHPFFQSDEIDVSLYWKRLFAGEIVGEIYFIRPRINFIDDRSPKNSQSGAGEPWIEVVKKTFPVRLDRVEIVDGEIWLRNPRSVPPVHVHMENVYVTARNLSNQPSKDGELPATINAMATMMGTGKLDLNVRLDPLAEQPRFDLEARVLGLQLPQFNELFKAYGKFDVEHGYFDLATEIKATNGRISGYVKPLFRELRVFSWKKDAEEESERPIQVAWEAIVATVTEVFQNQPRDQVATKIPLSGTLVKPDANFLETFVNVLRNAFVRAFMPTIEQSVQLRRDE